MSLMQAPIYIVDDEIKIVDILKTSLEMTGLNVYGFVSGEEFFNEVTSFDDNSVLILDLQMPIMDGIEVMRKLAKMDTQPAIILISGHDASVLRAAEKLCVAHDFKVLDCLSKPVSLDEVKYLILQNSLVNNHSESKRSKNNKLNIVPSELKYAIENNQFILYYQPQISISTNQFIGVEALIRWQHPERGLLMPDSFISIAEENGLIGDLTSYVISCVVKQEKIWQDLGVKISVSVNISADNITSLMLPEQLSELLKDNTIDPGRLILEVTESALMGELVTSLDILTRLRMKATPSL